MRTSLERSREATGRRYRRPKSMRIAFKVVAWTISCKGHVNPGMAVRRKGSILLEASMAMGIFCLSAVAMVELVRRAHHEAVLHHAACTAARSALWMGRLEGLRRAREF